MLTALRRGRLGGAHGEGPRAPVLTQDTLPGWAPLPRRKPLRRSQGQQEGGFTEPQKRSQGLTQAGRRAARSAPRNAAEPGPSGLRLIAKGIGQHLGVSSSGKSTTSSGRPSTLLLQPSTLRPRSGSLKLQCEVLNDSILGNGCELSFRGFQQVLALFP